MYQVNKFLRDISRSAELAGQCVIDIDAILKNYQLTREEEEALKGWEVKRLYDQGANPFLLLVYSAAIGKGIPAYSEAINQEL
jgi:hypothetical protein